MKHKPFWILCGGVGILCVWYLLSLLPLLSGTVIAQTDLTCEDLAPTDSPPTYYIGLGDAYFTQGNYPVAVVAYTCAIDLDPTHAPSYVHRGFAYAAQYNDAQAMADYNGALELDEGLLAAYNNRGMLYMRQGNFGLAINDFALVIALDPSSAVAYTNRGLVHAAEKNYDLAIADFEQAIALDPDYAMPHAALGTVYTALALESYATYLEIDATTARLPGGQPDDVLNALIAAEESGNISLWLAYLTRLDA